MAYLQWMITDIVYMFLVVFSMLGNGMLTTLIACRSTLRKRPAYYLIAALTTNHFLLGLSVIPHVSLLLSGLAPEQTVNYSATPTIITSAPIPFFTITTSVLTLGVAFDRMRAIVSPVTYRFVNQARQVILIQLVGLSLATFISYLHLSGAFYTAIRPGCSAGCCFCGPTFLGVFGIVTVVINVTTTIFCAILMVFLRKQHNKTRAETNINDPRAAIEENMFKRANIIAIYILLGSTCFVSIPYIINITATITKTDVFKQIGPYLAITTFMSGSFNVIIFGLKHSHVRAGFLSLCGKKSKVVTVAARTN